MLLVLAGTTAHAEPPGATAPIYEPMVVHVKPPKSETTATALTLAGVALPIALTYLTYEPDTDAPMYVPLGFTTGLILPAIGHWYAGRVGTYGMLIRLGGLVVFATGLASLDDADRCARGEEVPDGCEASDRAVGRAAIGLGIAAWAGSWVYDVFSARREVRRYNRRHTVQIMPMVARDTTGITIGGSF